MKNYNFTLAKDKDGKLVNQWAEWSKIVSKNYGVQVDSFCDWMELNYPKYEKIETDDSVVGSYYAGSNNAGNEKNVFFPDKLKYNQYWIAKNPNYFLWQDSDSTITNYVTKHGDSNVIEKWDWFLRRASDDPTEKTFLYAENINNVMDTMSTENGEFSFDPPIFTDLPVLNQNAWDTKKFYFVNRSTGAAEINKLNYNALKTIRIGTTFLSKNQPTGLNDNFDFSKYLKFYLSDADVYYPNSVTKDLEIGANGERKYTIYFKRYEKGTANFGTTYYMIIDPYMDCRRWYINNDKNFNYYNTRTEISSYSYDDNNGITLEIRNGKIAWTGQPIISKLISWDQQKGTYDEVIANTTVETSIQNIDNRGYWFYTININNSRQDQDFQIGNIGNTFVFIC